MTYYYSDVEAVDTAMRAVESHGPFLSEEDLVKFVIDTVYDDIYSHGFEHGSERD